MVTIHRICFSLGNVISSLVLSRFDFDNSISSFVNKNFNGAVPSKTGKYLHVTVKADWWVFFMDSVHDKNEFNTK